MLTKGSKVLIIDAKYYTHTTQAQYDVHTIHSSNLYQIFTYVKNKDAEFGDKPHTVSGMLLYAATDEAVQPNNRYQMSGNQISVRTLDLNRGGFPSRPCAWCGRGSSPRCRGIHPDGDCGKRHPLPGGL